MLASDIYGTLHMNEKEKIWVILPYGNERGGLETIAAKLIDRISKGQGRRCIISIPRHTVSMEYTANFDKKLCTIDWMITGHGLTGSYLFWSAVALLGTLVRLLLFRPKLVIIHLPFAFGCLGPMLALALVGQRTVVIHHHAAPDRAPSPLRRRLYQWIFRRNQTWVAVSDDARVRLARYFGVDSDFIKRVYNGLPPLPVEPGSVSFRSELGALPDDIIVTTVSRLALGKGIEDLLPVSRILFSKVPNVRLVVAGGGPLFDEIVARFKDDPEGRLVQFLGHRSDIGRILRESDVFLFPSLSEGLPLSLVEALQAALPVVAYRITSIPEIVKQNRNGLLVEKGDWRALADSIILLSQNAELRKALGKNGPQDAARFTEAVMLENYDRLLADSGALPQEKG